MANLPTSRRDPSKSCIVCYENAVRSFRSCCKTSLCQSCLARYVRIRILETPRWAIAAAAQIDCPNTDCRQPFRDDEIRKLIAADDEAVRRKYDEILSMTAGADDGEDGTASGTGKAPSRSCPRCSLLTTAPDDAGVRTTRASWWTGTRRTTQVESPGNPHGVNVHCSGCQLDWCFVCYAPYHVGQTCRQYRSSSGAGEGRLNEWAIETQAKNGERNAMKCPTCKVSA